MSTYQLQLPEKITYLAIIEYSKKYASWKRLAVSMLDSDDDDAAITGMELRHIDAISKFLKFDAFRTVSVMSVADVLWQVSEYNPETEGQAKRIVLDKLQ